MNRSPAKKPARGAFLAGIWHCDCEPRLPAEHFQTKNGGQNHGRWFYTCQKSQPKRCKFFLWDDDAKVREESAVLNNARSEIEPKTPTKPIQPARQLNSPHQSPAQQAHQALMTPSSKTRAASTTSNDSDFYWSASNDQALVEAAQAAAMAPPETPRKTPRTSNFTSPGKWNHSEMLASNSGLSTSPSNDDIFNTPRSSHDASGLLSPAETPVRGKSHAAVSPPANSSLAADALRILDSSKLSHEVEQKLVDLLNKHDLRTEGIAKGRDITRLALNNKDAKIVELEARISGLEAERETSKAVIAHLKSDIFQTSSSKGRKRAG
jgi:GRF zinc finger